MQTKKGFTLIELLVVIAIVAVLSVVVILTLNPAELLKQARDSNRISDLNTIKSALSFYLSDVTTPVLVTNGAGYARCYLTATAANCAAAGFATVSNVTVVTSTAVTGGGWVSANFNLISSKSPLSRLPIDPTNTSTYLYGYVATSSDYTFKLTAAMESSKYAQNGGADVESTDGGNYSAIYEVGTNLAL